MLSITNKVLVCHNCKIASPFTCTKIKLVIQKKTLSVLL